MRMQSFSPAALMLSMLHGGMVTLVTAVAAESNGYTQWVAKNLSRDRPIYYERSATLGVDKVALHWTILSDDVIRLAVAVKATGWFGVGMTEMGGMSGSDILLYEAAHPDRILDCYATTAAKPSVDEQQDWKWINSETTDDGFMIVEVERKLDTGDPMDWTLTDDSDLYLPGGTKVIAAWGDEEEVTHHALDRRIQGSVRFFGKDNRDDKARFEQDLAEADQRSILLQAKAFVVPHKSRTFYHWQCFTVQELIQSQNLPSDAPLHAVGFEWIVDRADLIHHIVLYSSPQEKFAKCDPIQGPTLMFYAWNKGQDQFFQLPHNVGMLLADESGNSIAPKSFRLEIHYENVKKVKGVEDNSGVRVHYTSRLREQTAAIMTFGDPLLKLHGQGIGMGLQRHAFHCPESCTKNVIPQGTQITVLNEFLHMHKHGLTMHNIHKRDGKELRRGSVQYFDFDQGIQVVRQKPFTVAAGDSFETICHYQGAKRLKFGLAGENEMCFGGFLYYPVTNAQITCNINDENTKCVSSHSSSKLTDGTFIGRIFGEASGSLTVRSGAASSAAPAVQFTTTPTTTKDQQHILQPNAITVGKIPVKTEDVSQPPLRQSMVKSSASKPTENIGFLKPGGLLLAATAGIFFIVAILAYVRRHRRMSLSKYKKVATDDTELQGDDDDLGLHCPVTMGGVVSTSSQTLARRHPRRDGP